MLHRINKPILKYIKQNVNVLIKERLSKYNISLIFPCDAETKTFQLSMKEKEKILLFEMLLLREAIRKKRLSFGHCRKWGGGFKRNPKVLR